MDTNHPISGIMVTLCDDGDICATLEHARRVATGINPAIVIDEEIDADSGCWSATMPAHLVIDLVQHGNLYLVHNHTELESEWPAPTGCDRDEAVEIVKEMI